MSICGDPTAPAERITSFFALTLIIWFFLLKTKNKEVPTDELKIKDEELKNAQIDLATRDAELKAAVDARKDLDKQLNDKKVEVSNLYKKVDGIVEAPGAFGAAALARAARVGGKVRLGNVKSNLLPCIKGHCGQ